MKSSLLVVILWFVSEASSTVVENLNYSISGSDFYDDFMTKSKPLLVREGCKTWSLYEQFNNGNISDEIGKIPLVAWPICTPNYGNEECTMREFIDDIQYGKMFTKNLTTDATKGLLQSIETPLMVASCRDILDQFAKSLELEMFGYKLNAEEGLSRQKLRCIRTHTFLATISGQMRVYEVGNDVKFSTVTVNAGDLIYLPPKTCFRTYYNNLSIVVMMSWTQRNMDSVKCHIRSLYAKDSGYDSTTQVSEDKEAKPQILKTGYTIPPVGFGTSRLFDKTYESVSKALEVGYRLIDTAQMYTSTDILNSEQEIGRAIKDSPVAREDIFLITKIDPDAFKPTRENTFNSMKKSMESLQTDYLDLVLIHYPYDDEICDEFGCQLNLWDSWGALEELHDQGKIRSLGVSNVETVEDLKKIEERIKLPLSVVENWFDPFHQDVAIRKYCKQRDIVYIGYSTLGLLWIDKEKGMGMEYNPVLNDPTIKRMALATDMPPATAILRWAMYNDVIVIPCTTNPDHMETNFYSRQMTITNNMISMVNELDNTFTFNDISMTMQDFTEKHSLSHEIFIEKMYAEVSQDNEEDDEEEDEEQNGAGNNPDLPGFEMGSQKDEL